MWVCREVVNNTSPQGKPAVLGFVSNHPGMFGAGIFGDGRPMGLGRELPDPTRAGSAGCRTDLDGGGLS